MSSKQDNDTGSGEEEVELEAVSVNPGPALEDQSTRRHKRLKLVTIWLSHAGLLSAMFSMYIILLGPEALLRNSSWPGAEAHVAAVFIGDEFFALASTVGPSIMLYYFCAWTSPKAAQSPTFKKYMKILVVAIAVSYFVIYPLEYFATEPFTVANIVFYCFRTLVNYIGIVWGIVTASHYAFVSSRPWYSELKGRKEKIGAIFFATRQHEADHVEQHQRAGAALVVVHPSRSSYMVYVVQAMTIVTLITSWLTVADPLLNVLNYAPFVFLLPALLVAIYDSLKRVGETEKCFVHNDYGYSLLYCIAVFSIHRVLLLLATMYYSPDLVEFRSVVYIFISVLWSTISVFVGITVLRSGQGVYDAVFVFPFHLFGRIFFKYIVMFIFTWEGLAAVVAFKALHVFYHDSSAQMFGFLHYRRREAVKELQSKQAEGLATEVDIAKFRLVHHRNVQMLASATRRFIISMYVELCASAIVLVGLPIDYALSEPFFAAREEGICAAHDHSQAYYVCVLSCGPMGDSWTRLVIMSCAQLLGSLLGAVTFWYMLRYTCRVLSVSRRSLMKAASTHVLRMKWFLLCSAAVVFTLFNAFDRNMPCRDHFS